MPLFRPQTPSHVVAKAQKKLGDGKLDEAARTVRAGLERFPHAAALLDLELGIRRAQALKPMRHLEKRIEHAQDPLAFEELIQLYRELELPDEAQRKAESYAEAHPTRDAPHLVLGEMYLATFLEELSARHGHAAHDHLLQASNLNAMSLQPRILLAELYYCIGADRSLVPLLQSLRQMAPETPETESAFELLEKVANPHHDERLDGIFERVELEGELARDPQEWPLSRRRQRTNAIDEAQADDLLQELVSRGVVDEIVLLRRDGSVVSHVSPTGVHGVSEDDADTGGTLIQATAARPEAGHFIQVVRTVGRKVFPRARDLDLGRFNRCMVRGSFGHVVVGRVCNVLVGVRSPRSADPAKGWQGVCSELESITGASA